MPRSSRPVRPAHRGLQQNVPLEFGTSSPVAIIIPLQSYPQVVLDAPSAVVDHGHLVNKSSAEHVRLVRQRARELLQFTGGPLSPMPGKNPNSYATKVSDSDLDAMVGLSQDILANLERIVAARKREDGKRMRLEDDDDDEDDYLDDDDAASERWMQRSGRSAKQQQQHHHHNQRKYRNTRLVCHACDIVQTPQWRLGPDGPGTLCNVCGLVYARRCRKK